MRAPASLAILLALVVAPGARWASAATITVVNVDLPGVGFNDPTPAAPVGGNPGVTIGQQRLNAVQHAADIWGSILPSAVEIRVRASWGALSCSPTFGYLGFAGPIAITSDFAGSEHPNTWYAISLANRLAGIDLAPGVDDIDAQFNSEVGTPACLTGLGWYYGFDNNASSSQFDLVTTALHELAHGLGSLEFVDDLSGALPGGQIDVYSRLIFDNTAGKRWDQMTDAERAASAINTGNVVWDGAEVTVAAPSFLGYRPVLDINSPASIAGTYTIGTAAFGAPLTLSGVTGVVVLVNDGTGVASDACDPIVNGPQLAGNIALIDRGGCTFAFKVKAAQTAGAIAVIVVNNVPGGSVISMGGTDPTITIPAVMVSLEDGNAIKAELGSGVSATLHLDPNHLAGADDTGRLLLYAPNPNVAASSISHWDLSATPDLLMEPNIPDLIPQTGDLTVDLFHDIGWFPVDIPVDIEGLVASSTGAGVTLAWQLGPEALFEVRAIGVERALAPEGPYVDLTSVPLDPARSMSYEDLDVEDGTSYWYRLQLQRSDGATEFSPAVQATFVAARNTTAVLAAHESPDGRTVQLRYSIARSSDRVELEIYDIAGRRVRALDSGPRAPGEHRIVWDRTDASGSRVARGVYLVRLASSAGSATRKVVLLRQ